MPIPQLECRLLHLGEKKGTDRGKELTVNKVEAGGHGVVANNLAIVGGEGNTTVGGLGEVLLPVLVEDDIGTKLNTGLLLDEADILLDGGGEDGLDGGDVLSAAVDRHIVLLDLDEALND